MAEGIMGRRVTFHRQSQGEAGATETATCQSITEASDDDAITSDLPGGSLCIHPLLAKGPRFRWSFMMSLTLEHSRGLKVPIHLGQKHSPSWSLQGLTSEVTSPLPWGFLHLLLWLGPCPALVTLHCHGGLTAKAPPLFPFLNFLLPRSASWTQGQTRSWQKGPFAGWAQCHRHPATRATLEC